MSLPLKAILWRQLKEAESMGVEVDFQKTYVQYTAEELQAMVDRYIGSKQSFENREEDVHSDLPAFLNDSALYENDNEVVEEAQPWLDIHPAAIEIEAPQPAPEPEPAPAAPVTAAPSQPQSGTPRLTPTQIRAHYLAHPELWSQTHPQTLARILGVPFSDQGADRAGLTQNTHGPNDPVRVDSLGRVWYMDEVLKPAIPKPRMVRKSRQITNYVEILKTENPDGSHDTFEVAGSRQSEMEIRVTLPSSQVGIYRDPRFPFRIHQYNGRRGFDQNEVRDFYGGLDLIPASIKTLYIDGDLCYDINTVRDTIEREHREKVLGRSQY